MIGRAGGVPLTKGMTEVPFSLVFELTSRTGHPVSGVGASVPARLGLVGELNTGCSTSLNVCLAILLALFAAEVLNAADEVSYPNLSGEVEFEGRHERLYGSGAAGSEDSPFEVAAAAELFLQVSDRTQMAMELGLEELDEDGLDLLGRSFGLQFDSIVLRYEHEYFALFGGKFSPNFSVAHDVAPGLYGDDLPSDDIALEEFVGLGGSFNLKRTAAGAPAISGSVFRLDRSLLSKPLFSHEERVRLADDGPGNTQSFRSHALAIEFEDIPGMPGIRYHLGWARLGVERGNPEHRFASAAQWRFETADRAEFSTLAEIVHFLNADGDSDLRRTYFTGSLEYNHKGLNGSVVFTVRKKSGGDAEGSTLDYQVSVGYEFENDVSLEAGFKRTREDGVERSTLGTKVTWALEF